MTLELLDSMVSLTALMEEESAQLARSAFFPTLGEIAAAKTRLVGRIEAEVARLRRETPDWMDTLEPEARQALTDASEALRDASDINARILSRQIELSSDMLAAIANEAKRLTGRRNTTYGACGNMATMDLSAPISINARL